MNRTIYKKSESTMLIDKKVRDALNQLGVFVRSDVTSPFLPNNIWYECGYELEEIEHEQWLSYVHDEEKDRIEYAWNAFVAGTSNSFEETYRFKTKNGKWNWNSSRCVAIERDTAQKLILYMGNDTDFTHLKATEHELRKAKEQADRRVHDSEIIRSIIAMVAGSLKLDQTIQMVLDQIKVIINYQTAKILLKQDNTLLLAGSKGYETTTHSTKSEFSILDTKNPYTDLINEQRPMIYSSEDTEYQDFFKKVENSNSNSLAGIPLVANKRVIGVVTLEHRNLNFFTRRDLQTLSLLSDHFAISIENAQLHENIFHLAMVDSLMQIGSRHSFNFQGKIIFSQAVRYQRSLVTLMIDVDKFKSVNDTYGHDVGDIVLKGVALQCAQTLRSSDIIARYGGEEIVVLLPETDSVMGEMVAERIRKNVEDAHYAQIDKSISISIGLHVSIPQNNDTLGQAIQKADEALYKAKNSGRNRVVVYSSKIKD